MFPFANNFSLNNVTVYAPGADGNVSPVAKIAGPNTGMGRTISVAIGG